MCLLLLEGPSSYLTVRYALVTSARRTQCTEGKRIAANHYAIMARC